MINYHNRIIQRNGILPQKDKRFFFHLWFKWHVVIFNQCALFYFAWDIQKRRRKIIIIAFLFSHTNLKIRSGCHRNWMNIGTQMANICKCVQCVMCMVFLSGTQCSHSFTQSDFMNRKQIFYLINDIPLNAIWTQFQGSRIFRCAH